MGIFTVVYDREKQTDFETALQNDNFRQAQTILQQIHFPARIGSRTEESVGKMRAQENLEYSIIMEEAHWALHNAIKRKYPI